MALDSLSDLVSYLLVCALLVAAGHALLSLARVQLSAGLRLLLAPVMGQSLWAILLGAGVAFGFPVRQLALPVWAVTVLVALYGLWTIAGRGGRGSGDGAARGASWLLLGVSALVPLVLLYPDSLSGLSSYGGVGSDGWSYVAYASYLWQVPKGTEGGLPPILQWASHLMMTRHVGGAELGLLSMLHAPGDVQRAEGLFVAIGLFGASAACAAFAREYGLRTWSSVLLVIASMVSGWILNVLQTDNYDFGVTLAYLPAIAALVRAPGTFTAARWGLVAWLAAALFYTYPELAPVIFGCVACLLVDRLWREPRRLLIGISIVLLGFIILTAPYLPQSAIYFNHQAATALAQPGTRPGEGFFPGMLIPAQQPSAFWGLGGEFDKPFWQTTRLFAGLALFVLLMAGLVRLARQREWGLIVIAGLLMCGTAIFIVHHAYPYGAYKFIVIGWWLFVLAAFLGATWPFAFRQRLGVVAVVCSGIAVALLLVFPVVTVNRLVRSAPLLGQRAADRFRPVAQLKYVAGTEPIGVFVRDPFAGYWAAYFLRDARIQMLALPGYLGMSHVRWRLERAPAIPLQSIHLLLTDADPPGLLIEDEGWKLVWRAGPYCLWDTQGRGWALAVDATTPNGDEAFQGQRFFWMGGGPTSLAIVASEAGAARLAAQFAVGPNLSAETKMIRVRVKNSLGADRVESIAPGQGTICLPVPPGATAWTLTPIDPFVPSPRPTTDPRQLMISVLGPRLLWHTSAQRPVDGC